MRTFVSKWGNSLAIRIPKPFAQEVGVEHGTPIELHIKKGQMILSRPEFSLTDLLSHINEKNVHAETDTGEFLGNEQW